MALAEARAPQMFWDIASELRPMVEALQERLETTRDVGDVEAAVVALAESLPPQAEDYSEADPYLTRALHTGAIDALLALRTGKRAELRVAIERMRQALRDMTDERPVWRAGPKDAAVWLGQAGLSTETLSEVFSVSADTVRRWINPDNPQSPSDENADKVVVVAKIVNHLRHAMTPRGVAQWLMREHSALDDRRPIDELKDVESYQRLIRLASGARSFVAT